MLAEGFLDGAIEQKETKVYCKIAKIIGPHMHFLNCVVLQCKGGAGGGEWARGCYACEISESGMRE